MARQHYDEMGVERAEAVTEGEEVPLDLHIPRLLCFRQVQQESVSGTYLACVEDGSSGVVQGVGQFVKTSL
ncbi:hypothetical protein CP982_08690 [Streptomyces spectabilis]|uniref:Uncharacterized protein n=1 Tax=Streptomyces spectabilis TaxID=68270 RepID=A0A5P2X678_STRST|nr:hypothetical protein CP982_08690 [Streptomyces spectabilis]